MPVAALALAASACGGGGGNSGPIQEPDTTPIVTTEPKVPKTHGQALAYVKQCRAALARTRVGPVTAKQAKAANAEVTQAVADCDHSDELNALVDQNRADPSVYGAYLGEIAVFYGLQSFQKYVRAIVAGRRGPNNVLLLAKEQIAAGKVYLDEAVVELPYPP